MRTEQQQRLIGHGWRLLETVMGASARRAANLHPALQAEAIYQTWLGGQQPAREELERQRHLSATWASPPFFSLVMPVFRPPLAPLVAAVESVQAQTYPRWELCITDSGPPGEGSRWLAEHARREPRLKVQRAESNGGISANTNAAIARARGDFVAFLDQDDLLTPDALFHMADRLRARPDLDLLYSDKDNITPWGGRYAPLLKPSWSPELLLCANYLTHLTVVRREALGAAGALDSAMDGAQDWDLFLRISERTTRIAHVPRILYHWRSMPTSCASTMTAKPYAMAAQRRAVDAHLSRRGIAARAEHEPSGVLRVRPAEDVGRDVTLVLDRVGAHLLGELRRARGGRGAVLDVVMQEGGGWSERMNAGAAAARGDFLLFWDTHLKPLSPGWVSELAFWASLPGVGCAGARVHRPKGPIETSGMVLAHDGTAYELFAAAAARRWTPLGAPDWYRNLLSVGYGCLMTPRPVFRELGGFDITLLPRAALIDYGLRVHESGRRNVHVPFVGFTNFGEPAPMLTAASLPPRLERYRAEGGDPFFNPQLPLDALPQDGARHAVSYASPARS